MSASAIASSVAARAVASGQSVARKLVSNETIAPAARAARIAAKHVARAVAEIAREMPERWRTRVCASAASCDCASGQPARRRAAAKEAEVVSRSVVADEVDRGERIGVGRDAGIVDPFFAPHRAQHRAVDVVAERREIADLRALPRRRDGEVRGVAAEALQIDAARGLAGLVELDHRLAEGEDVRCRHCRSAAIATRSGA